MIFPILWNVIVFWLAIAQPHPSLDKHHCAFLKEQFVLECWPKNGCFMLDADDAMCWRERASLVGHS